MARSLAVEMTPPAAAANEWFTLRHHGSGCGEFPKLAIPILNQVIRPFTGKWHRLSLAGAFNDQARCEEFRHALTDLRPFLRNYTRALADMAAVEDLTSLEEGE